MKKFILAYALALLVLSSEVIARKTVDEIDLEVVSLLNLNDAQALAYSTIMQHQRALYHTLNPRGREQQRAFYQHTFRRLEPVLTTEQHIRFVGYMDSFLEAIPDEDLLVME